MRRQIAGQSAERRSIGRMLEIASRRRSSVSFEVMPEGSPTTESAASPRERAVAHEDGPLLIAGAPGTGKTELLARRLGRLVASGTRPESVLMIASRQATAGRLRERCEALLECSFEELWIGSWDVI